MKPRTTVIFMTCGNVPEVEDSGDRMGMPKKKGSGVGFDSVRFKIFGFTVAPIHIQPVFPAPEDTVQCH